MIGDRQNWIKKSINYLYMSYKHVMMIVGAILSLQTKQESTSAVCLCMHSTNNIVNCFEINLKDDSFL